MVFLWSLGKGMYVMERMGISGAGLIMYDCLSGFLREEGRERGACTNRSCIISRRLYILCSLFMRALSIGNASCTFYSMVACPIMGCCCSRSFGDSRKIMVCHEIFYSTLDLSQ